MINLYINERRTGDVTILDLKGKLRVGGNSLGLHKSIRTLVAEKKIMILLNLTDVTFIDSSGLGELVASQISVENSGGEIKLLGVTGTLRDLFAATRLSTVFDAYQDEEGSNPKLWGRRSKACAAAVGLRVISNVQPLDAIASHSFFNAEPVRATPWYVRVLAVTFFENFTLDIRIACSLCRPFVLAGSCGQGILMAALKTIPISNLGSASVFSVGLSTSHGFVCGLSLPTASGI